MTRARPQARCRRSSSRSGPHWRRAWPRWRAPRLPPRHTGRRPRAGPQRAPVRRQTLGPPAAVPSARARARALRPAQLHAAGRALSGRRRPGAAGWGWAAPQACTMPCRRTRMAVGAGRPAGPARLTGGCALSGQYCRLAGRRRCGHRAACAGSHRRRRTRRPGTLPKAPAPACARRPTLPRRSPPRAARRAPRQAAARAPPRRPGLMAAAGTARLPHGCGRACARRQHRRPAPRRARLRGRRAARNGRAPARVAAARQPRQQLRTARCRVQQRRAVQTHTAARPGALRARWRPGRRWRQAALLRYRSAPQLCRERRACWTPTQKHLWQPAVRSVQGPAPATSGRWAWRRPAAAHAGSGSERDSGSTATAGAARVSRAPRTGKMAGRPQARTRRGRGRRRAEQTGQRRRLCRRVCR